MATINPFALVQKQLTQAISAAQQAAKSAAQNSSSSGSSRRTSSGSSSGSGQSSSASWYTPMGANTDEEIRNKSPQSWNLIQQAKEDYTRAQAAGDAAGMARAHQTAEQIRAQFGYSGGEDGSLYVPYQMAPAYQPAVQQPMWDTSGWGAGSSSGVSQAQAEAQALYEQQLAELERAREAEQRALQAEIDRTLLALSAQIPGIERSAADANAAAYETWLRATNPFGAAAQRQSQLGLLNSGYSESSLASLGNTYQSVVGQNEQARVDSLRQIDLAREQTRLEGGIEKANQMAEFAKLIAQQRFNQGSALLDAAVQDRQLGLSQQQFAYEMGLAQRRLAYETDLARRELDYDMEQEDRRLTYEMEQEERSQLETLAELLARYGIFDGYRALGLSDEQIAAMEAYWRALQARE